MKNLFLLFLIAIPFFLYAQVTLENSTTNASYNGNVLDSYVDGFIFDDKEKGLLFISYDDVKQDLRGLTKRKYNFSPGKEIEKGANLAIIGVLIPVITTSAALLIQNNNEITTLFGAEKKIGTNMLIIAGSSLGLIMNISGFSRIAKGGKYLDVTRI